MLTSWVAISPMLWIYAYETHACPYGFSLLSTLQGHDFRPDYKGLSVFKRR